MREEASAASRCVSERVCGLVSWSRSALVLLNYTEWLISVYEGRSDETTRMIHTPRPVAYPRPPQQPEALISALCLCGCAEPRISETPESSCPRLHLTFTLRRLLAPTEMLHLQAVVPRRQEAIAQEWKHRRCIGELSSSSAAVISRFLTRYVALYVSRDLVSEANFASQAAQPFKRRPREVGRLLIV